MGWVVRGGLAGREPRRSSERRPAGGGAWAGLRGVERVVLEASEGGLASLWAGPVWKDLHGVEGLDVAEE